jgi:hypothetical protein
LDLTHIYRIFHPAAAQYTFFSVVHGIFSKVDHILDLRKVFINIRKLKYLSVFCQTTEIGRAPMTHTFNPSYLGGRDQEDHSSKPAQADGS